MPNPDLYKNVLKDIDNLYNNVYNPREKVLDAHLFSDVTTIGKIQTSNIPVDNFNFNVTEFIKLIAEHYTSNDDQINWDHLAKDSSLYLKPTPTLKIILSPSFTSMFNQQKMTPTKRKFTKSIESETTHLRPVQVDGIENEKTTKQIKKIFNVLKNICNKEKGSSLRLMEFIIDPSSFSKTIENIFHLSFLVKDNMVVLDIKDGDTTNSANMDYSDIMIRVVNSSSTDDVMSTQNSKDDVQQRGAQFMLHLNMDSWKKYIDRFNIKKALID